MKRFLLTFLVFVACLRAEENPFLQSHTPKPALVQQDWGGAWKSPVTAVLQSATYTARLDGKILRCEAAFKLRSFAEDWQTVPLAGGEWSLDTTVALPASISVVRREDQIAVLIHEAGDLEIRLPLALELSAPPSKFTLLPAAAQRFTIASPPNDHVLTLNDRAPTLNASNELAYVLPPKGGAVVIALADDAVAQPEAQVSALSRIACCAPVSVIFFFALLLMIAVTMRVSLHPTHWTFLAAASFAFQFLYAYAVDSMPTPLSLGIASLVSIGLMTSYLNRHVSPGFGWVSLLAQFAYVGVFSYSYFVDAAAGVVMTLGALVVLGLLVLVLARERWSVLFGEVRRDEQATA